MSSRTGAGLVVEALAAAGVKHLFTLSGNQILSLYEAAAVRGLALVHTRHEAAAVHMADAWGRLTDEPGVALVTAGPGHANALGALYGALMAESPLVMLSGHASRAEHGSGAFQEMDQVGVARPMVKAAWLAEDSRRLADDLVKALAIAREGKPGPVHVSIPADVLEAHVPELPPVALPREDRGMRLDDGAVQTIVAMLRESRRPLILSSPSMGRGKRWTALRQFSELSGIPALPMESPRGTSDPWLHEASACFGEADLVLLCGKPLDFSVRFGRTPTFSPRCRFIQIAPGAPLPPKSDRIGTAIDADPWLAVEQLAASASSLGTGRGSWAADVTRARRAVPASWEELRRSPKTPLHPLRVCAALQRYVDAGAVFVSDGGEFGQWAQSAIEASERLINGPAGSIGSGIPMALAAKLARPDRLVFLTLGDGSFGFHAFELDTAVRHRLPIVVVIGNDARWNAEYQLQVRQYGQERALGCELLPSRYDLVAAALGGHGELVERAEDLDGAIARAVASGLPACVNVMIEGVAAPTFQVAAASH